MNNPEYYLVDEIGACVAAVKTVLNLPVLNYQYGTVKEISELLNSYSKTAEFRVQKFPMVWLFTNYTIKSAGFRIYGTTKDVRILILTPSTINQKSVQREEVNFKPIIYPIFRELLNQIAERKCFTENLPSKINEQHRNFYFLSPDGKRSELNDIVDALQIYPMELNIKNNPNCSITIKT